MKAPDIAHAGAIATVQKFLARHYDDYLDIVAHYRLRGLAGLELHHVSLSRARVVGLPFEEVSSANQLVNVGIQLWEDLLIGAGGTVYNNANAALGVGDSNAAFAASQTNLQGAVNVTDRIRKAMNATYPSRATNTVTFQSTFATTEANFTWNEWGIFNNVTDGSGTMLNRAVTNLGTKTNASAWQLTTTLVLS